MKKAAVKEGGKPPGLGRLDAGITGKSLFPFLYDILCILLFFWRFSVSTDVYGSQDLEFIASMLTLTVVQQIEGPENRGRQKFSKYRRYSFIYSAYSYCAGQDTFTLSNSEHV